MFILEGGEERHFMALIRKGETIQGMRRGFMYLDKDMFTHIEVVSQELVLI